MHTYIHTHAYIHTYIHSYIHNTYFSSKLAKIQIVMDKIRYSMDGWMDGEVVIMDQHHRISYHTILSDVGDADRHRYIICIISILSIEEELIEELFSL